VVSECVLSGCCKLLAPPAEEAEAYFLVQVNFVPSFVLPVTFLALTFLTEYRPPLLYALRWIMALLPPL